MAALEQLVTEIPDEAFALARAFWPGPLTLILPASSRVPKMVTAGLSTVAVRMPGHPVAQALIRTTGTPIAAPSANRFKHVSPTTAQHAFADLQGRVQLILDSGPCEVGVESTILDLCSDTPTILRPGGLSLEAFPSSLSTRDCATTLFWKQAFNVYSGNGQLPDGCDLFSDKQSAFKRLQQLFNSTH